MIDSNYEFKILKALQADSVEWNKYIKDNFDDNPMMKSSYLELFAESDDRCYCAFIKDDTGKMAYPFIVRKIINQSNQYDTTTPYGYGGPTTSGSLKEATKELFWSELKKWFIEENIVSEFIRFALFDTDKTGYIGSREIRMQNIVRTLDIPLDEMWFDFEHKVRKNINRAKRHNLNVEIELTGKRIDEFLEIYYETMMRRDASDGYYFDKLFFEYIHKKMCGNFAYFFVMDGNKCISTELVLHSKTTIYSYLGGTQEDYFTYRPNDLLKYEIINWGIENKMSRFILGGGYGENDGIFRYKKSFAPHGVVDFYVGKKIYDVEKYNKLCAGKIIDENSGFFPLYRS